MTEQQACTLCGAGGHTAAQCHWNSPGALESIRLPKHGTTIALEEMLAGYLPDDREYIRDVIEAYADIQARKAVMLYSGAGLAGRQSDACDWLENLEGDAWADACEEIAASVQKHTEQAEGAQGERERFEAWWNDPAQWELRKSCAMGWGEKIWRAAQGALARQVPEWSSAKPTVEGAYWVRGNGLNEPAVILVKLDQGELWCNLHMNNTETDFGYGYTIAQLSSEFEWFGPLAAAPGAQAGQVPQAWLDVQAERRRQVADEGWTPEHDNEHDHGQMARAAACYALAGSSAADDKTTALLVSLAWPWDQQWWKPTTARRDLVKACALTLAEIERLDRAAAAAQGGSHA